MAFGLTIGTERATALQNAIQDELMKRGFSPDADPVMAEYITIMIINNKTPAQISSELEDLIGSDFDASFVDWLFAEAAKGAPASEAPAVAEPSSSTHPPVRDSPPHQALDTQRRPPNGLRATAPIYQSAIAQALPSTSPSAQKRTASARSPSPSGGPPSKSRRTDLPTGPRAMFRDGPGGHGPGGGNSRSLLDRVGPARGGHGQYNPHDDVQARIDSITNGPPDPNMMMMNGGFPMNGMPGMDMNAMNMANPMMLQEMMMSQMAMMAQMAGAMGILPQGPQFMNGGMPMQPGMGGDMGGFNGMQGGMPHGGPDNRGRGRGRGAGRGTGRGRGGHVGHHSEGPSSNGVPASGPTPHPPAPTPATATTSAPVIAAPAHITASTSTGSTRGGFVAPERPQSPTLCKFSLKCTNPICRYSHPSPVATPESGVVLSNDACENGKNCKDKDCIKAHVSPAVLNPNAEVPKPNAFVAPTPPVQQQQPTAVPCRFGAGCTRAGCTFSHPPRQQQTGGHFAQPCRFGAACTRASCPFQHPEGRVLPTTFHRGLAPSGGMVNVPTPETGSIGAPSPHKSMSFKKADGAGEADAAAAKAVSPPTASSSAADLEKKVKEMEERKNEAQKAIAAAQAGKKDDASKAVPISA